MASDSTFPLIVGVGAGAAALYFWQKKKRAQASPLPQQAPAPPIRPPDPWADPQPVKPTAPTPNAPPMPPTQSPKTPSAPPAPSTTQPTPPSAPPKPSTTTPTAPSALPQLRGRWVWPVPMWNGRKPVISSGWGSPRKHGPHRGADIMFKREKGDPFLPGTPNGAKWHVMPDNLVAVAASDGVVWSAGWQPGGFSVVIDHGPQKVATYYTHMSQLFVTPTERAKSGQRVYAGQPIGIIHFDPRDGERLKHLHFELWLGGPKDAVDVAPIIKSWVSTSAVTEG